MANWRPRLGAFLVLNMSAKPVPEPSRRQFLKTSSAAIAGGVLALRLSPPGYDWNAKLPEWKVAKPGVTRFI